MGKTSAENLQEYGLVRCAWAVPELKVADIAFNLTSIEKLLLEIEAAQVQFALFPELCLTAYSSADLFFQKNLQDEALHALVAIKTFSKNIKTFFAVGLPLIWDGKIFNAAALVGQGKIWGIVPKSFLPNSFEYYEKRWFVSGKGFLNLNILLDREWVAFGTDLLFRFQIGGSNANTTTGQSELVLGLEICEDLWAPHPPSVDLCLAGALLIGNLSASSESIGKREYRRALVKQQSARLHAAYIYAGAGPSESSSDVVFSGHSLVAENGSILIECTSTPFHSTFAYVDIDLEKLLQERTRNQSFSENKPAYPFRTIVITSEPSPLTFASLAYPNLKKDPFLPSNEYQQKEVFEEIIGITTQALQKRARHVQPKALILGVSGGLDSTLVLLLLTLTHKYYSSDFKILPVLMPGLGSSSSTQSNAEKLCAGLGLQPIRLPIEKIFQQHMSDLGKDPKVADLTFENAQARLRTLNLMDLANAHQGLVIGTSDLSEIALGFSTYAGDQTSMYHLIGGIPKTLVRNLIHYLSAQVDYKKCRTTLLDIIATPISPELLPPKNDEIAQKTEDTLGPYELHDFFLYHFYRFGFRPKKIFVLAAQAYAGVFSEAIILQTLQTFYQRLFQNQFKRAAMPDSPKVGAVALSSRGDFRLPSDTESSLWLKELENLFTD